MTLEEVVQIVHAKAPQLSFVNELILQKTWEGQTYTRMAADLHYEAAYLKKVAAELWQFLSEIFGESINKANMRTVLEVRSMTPQQCQSLTGAPPQRLKRRSTAASFKYPCGPLPLGSSLYISRPPIESLVCQEMSAPGSLVRIKAPKMMGKSSLLIRMLNHAGDQGYDSVSLDFQHLSDRILETSTQFLRWFCASVSHQLELEPRLDQYWDDDIGSSMSCTRYLKRYVLEQQSNPLVVVLNEVDRLFEHRSAFRCFLPLLRSWHEEAKRTELMQKLRLVLVYSTDVYLPIDSVQSPFNVGFPLQLPSFTLEQSQRLALSYGLAWAQGESGADQLSPLQELTGGHPYLMQLACYSLYRGTVDLDSLLETAPTLAGIYRDHLRYYLEIVQELPDLMAALKRVVTAEQSVILVPKFAYKLESMGLVRLQGNQVVPSCTLYRSYFRTQIP